MKILGIDPSLTGTGYVILTNGKIESKQLVKTKPTGNNKIAELKRLIKIKDAFKTQGIDLAIIEGLAFMARNTSALVQLAGLSYLIREKLYTRGVPFIVVAPSSLKKFITGKGNSPKDCMLMEVYKRYGITFDNDNLCDAFSLAKIGTAILGNGKLTKFQKEVVELLKLQYAKHDN